MKKQQLSTNRGDVNLSHWTSPFNHPEEQVLCDIYAYWTCIPGEMKQWVTLPLPPPAPY